MSPAVKAKIEPCDHAQCGWWGPLAGLPHCATCGRHHPADFKHSSECEKPGCRRPCLVYRGVEGKWCSLHSEERRQARAATASLPLAEGLGQITRLGPGRWRVASFTDPNKSYLVEVVGDIGACDCWKSRNGSDQCKHIERALAAEKAGMR